MLQDLAKLVLFLLAPNRWLRLAATGFVLPGLLLLSVSGLAFSQTQNPPVEQQKPQFDFGPGQHELKGGQTDSFRVSLKAGDFLSALVVQQQIDISIGLFGPDGKKIAETDSPNDRWGPEPVLIVANQSGEFRVDIFSPNPRAAAGKYEIREVKIGPATPQDIDAVAVQRKFDEGTRLSNESSGSSRQLAVETLKETLSFYQSTHQAYREALTARALGVLYMQLGEFRSALPYLEQSMTLAETLHDSRQEEVLETFLGGANDVLGETDKALAHYNRALVLARQSGNQGVEASALNNIGKINNDASDWEKAIGHYLQALPLFRALGNRRTEGITLNNIGVAYTQWGEPEKSIDYLQQALTLLRAVKDTSSESYTLSNIGNSYRKMQDYQKALDFFQQAQAIQKQTNNRKQEADTLDLIGATYSGMGQPEKAISYHQEALKIQREAGNVRREGISLANLGHVYLLLNQPDQALEQLNASVVIFRKISDLNNAAVTLLDTAKAHQQKQDFDQARRDVEEAIGLVETVRARSTSPQLRSAYLASRENVYEFYIDLLMQLDAKSPGKGHDAEALQVSERARARSLLDTLNESSVVIRKGVSPELVDREKLLTQSLNAKAQRLIQLTALKGSQKEIEALKGEINSLEDEFRQVQASIRSASPAYAALTQPQPLGLKEIQDQLDPDSVLLEYSLGTDRSYLWLVTTNSLKVYELPGRSRIEGVARELYQTLTERSVIKAVETAPDRVARIARADSRAQELNNQLSDMILKPAAAKFGDKRLLIVADGALQYVPFAALALPGVTSSRPVSGYVARDSLQLTDNARNADYRPLILDHEVINLPSASTIAIQRRALANRIPAPKGVAVIADPVFSASDVRLRPREKSDRPDVKDAQRNASDDLRIIEHVKNSAAAEMVVRRLPFTRQEAQEILSVASGGANLRALDFQASRATALSSELSNYRYLHFATHGYLDTNNPKFSAIVLSLVDEQGRPEDGFLRTIDIYNLKIPAELVVLSACETGLGQDIKGEGLVGLTQGFMYAGARRVVVSLWSVNDKATASLMGRLYSGMLRMHKTPAAALRAAQIEMLRARQWQQPYFWAAFVMQGDWK
jgi:CHAT domain-containing protein/tetratricopeptide (TPR) repeat protein